MKSEYLTGKSLNLADIVVGAVLYRLTTQGLAVKLPDCVNTWYKNLSKRPGYVKWVMSDFTELRGREDF